MQNVLLILASFLASSVEMVEAITIVLAVGVTKGWRSALTGVAGGSVALAIVCVVLGPSLVTFVPLDVLRVVVGALLLIFGMQWMRKAIMRATGLKAKHDEALIFQNNIKVLESEAPEPVAGNAIDWQGFVVSFKGVFLEGLEVAFIVLTFGASKGTASSYGLAGLGALAAFLLIGGIGIAVHKPLSRVPENAIKFVVGIMLTSFGTFWGGEGIGVDWRLSDGTIVVLIAVYGALAFLLVELLKRRQASQLAVSAEAAS